MDKLLHTANLLVSLAAVSVAGGALGAAQAAITGALSFREVAGKVTPAITSLAQFLADDLRAGMANPEVTDDQRLLIPQMIEAALPAPVDIIGKALNAETLAETLCSRLTHPEHRVPANLALFRRLLTPALTRLLSDPTFATTLAPEFMRAVLGQLDRIEDKVDLLPGQVAALLGNLANASRPELVAVAARFEIAGANDLTDSALRRELEKRAEDWQSLRAQIAAIPETLKQLSNLKGAAQAAFDAGRFDEVEELLGRVQEVELEEAARTAELRAETALLRGRVEQAFVQFSAAADCFQHFNRMESVLQRVGYAERLYQHGLRYGGKGLALAAKMLRRAITHKVRKAEARLWASALNKLGNALSVQGERLGGDEGVALKGQAVAAYTKALEVRTLKDHPADWAATQNNLGNALWYQGRQTDGPQRAALLGEAAAAYAAALDVYTRADHPVNWATTKHNLGAVLMVKGMYTEGDEGATLLGQAVAAYTAALEVRTCEDHPLDWAITQHNLGVALAVKGMRTDGDEGAALLGHAVAAYTRALEVSTLEDQPVTWAETQMNLALAHLNIAIRKTCTDPFPPLCKALEHVSSALDVFDPKRTPLYHQQATALRIHILAHIAQRP